MANLDNKVSEFRRHFNITGEDKHVFKSDPEGNLIAVWNNEDYYLTHKRNPTKFLAVSTMQHKLKYGVDFLRDLKLVAPKVSRKKRKAKTCLLSHLKIKLRVLESFIIFLITQLMTQLILRMILKCLKSLMVSFQLC